MSGSRLRFESLEELGRGGLFADGDWVESKNQDPGGTVRLTQLADVGVGTWRDRSDRWLREDQAARLRCTFLEPGDLLIARMPDPLGRACQVPEGVGRAVTVVDVAVLRLRREDVDPRYVMHMINTPEFQASVAALQSGTTRKRISRRNLASLKLPLPGLHQQRRTVEILEDHLSRLEAAKELLAASRDRLRPLELLELQRAMDRSGASDVPLSEFVERVEAGRSFGGSAPPARADQWGIVKVSAMTWGEFRPSENKAVPASAVAPRFEIKPGDLLVSRANTTAYVGAAVLVGDTRPRLLLSDKSLRLVPRPGIDPRWLLAALTSPRARSQISALATGTKDSMRNISQANLLGVRLPDGGVDGRAVVVQLREQSAERGAKLAAELGTITTKVEGLRRSLLSAAFSGQLTSTVTTHKIEEMAGV